MKQVKKQTDFKQVKYNEAKMGAYYTDQEHCRWISHFLQFPEEDEVCCLEPSIGDGKAISIVTGKKAGQKNIKIYGVELNEETYLQVKDAETVDQCIKADFLNDVIISHNAFSFMFMNPPYGTSQTGERYELAFVRKIVPYLVKGAVIVTVVPQYVGIQEDFLKEWCDNFETHFLYRFHDKQYKQFKQVVLIGIKKRKAEEDEKEEKRLFSIMKQNEDMPILPTEYSGSLLSIPKSLESGIAEFMPRVFNPVEAESILVASPLQTVLRTAIQPQAYLIDNLGRPPIMPSEGHMYLLAVSGAGQGLVGNEKNGDLHLQRGVSKIVKRSEYVRDDDGKMKEVEISFPQVNYNIIESSGFIRILQ